MEASRQSKWKNNYFTAYNRYIRFDIENNLFETIIKYSLDPKKKGMQWSIHLLFWICIFLFIYFVFSVNFLKTTSSYIYMAGVFILVLITYYSIIFSFQSRHKYLWALSIVLTIQLFQYYTYYAFTYLTLLDVTDFYIPLVKKALGNLQVWQVAFDRTVFYYSYTLSLFHLAPPLAIKGVYELLRNFYSTQKLKEEKLNLELNYLRTQINPHFLLNILSAVYIRVREDKKAAQSIEKLSDLLRYSLYDAGHDKVTLTQEIHFIKNYISLARMRLDRNKKLIINIKGKSDGLMITPLILINIVENAIKHGLYNSSGASWAKIDINIDESVLSLDCRNHIPDNITSTETGIGLDNTRRRLNHYYPSNHSLKISTEQGIFNAHLIIDMK